MPNHDDSDEDDPVFTAEDFEINVEADELGPFLETSINLLDMVVDSKGQLSNQDLIEITRFLKNVRNA